MWNVHVQRRAGERRREEMIMTCLEIKINGTDIKRPGTELRIPFQDLCISLILILLYSSISLCGDSNEYLNVYSFSISSSRSWRRRE